MFEFKTTGSWDQTEGWLKRASNKDISGILNTHGAAGVAALSAATPVESGVTAVSWSHEVIRRPGYWSLRFYNSNQKNGQQVAILLQYGHATARGAYIQGRDYIMPTVRPIFDQIVNNVWKEVNR